MVHVALFEHGEYEVDRGVELGFFCGFDESDRIIYGSLNPITTYTMEEEALVALQLLCRLSQAIRRKRPMQRLVISRGCSKEQLSIGKIG